MSASNNPPAGKIKMVKIKPQDKSLGFDGSNVERFLDLYEMVVELDGTTEFDLAYQLRFFVRKDKVMEIVETLEGFESRDWTLLKAAMLAHWGKVDVAKFTSYLVRNDHVDSVEELRPGYYRAVSVGVQERIREHLIKEKSMILTKDHRFKLPAFAVLKKAVQAVMDTQTALTFKEPRSAVPVATSEFKEANDIMKKMEADCRPQAAPVPEKPATTIDEILRMLLSLEQRLTEMANAKNTVPAGGKMRPLVCYYCHQEGHGKNRCYELQKDKEESLVKQKGNSFFLPNGALIPFDSSRPICHVVALYQPPQATSSFALTEYKTGCGALQPWYPPAITSSYFSGEYEADPSQKRHKDPKLYKAPSVPPFLARQPPRKAATPPPQSPLEKEMEGVEQEILERLEKPKDSEGTGVVPEGPLLVAKPKVRFQREVACNHPNALDAILRKIADVKVPDLSVLELMAISPAVAEGMKKWVLRRRVEVGPEELKVLSGTLAEGADGRDPSTDPKLYSCPLVYLSCFISDEEGSANPLVDSGSQLNIISNALANKFNISPRVNFSSAVYGIGNQACELVGVAEDVPIRVGRNIVGTCHFWITRLKGPFILGPPFLIDFDATLMFSNQVGEKILLPNAQGRKIEISLCPADTGQWEQEFLGNGRKAARKERHFSFQDDKAQSLLHHEDLLRLNLDVRGSTRLLFQDRHFLFQDDKAQSPLHPKDLLRLNPDVRGSTCLSFQDRHFSFQDDKAQSPLHPKDLLRLNLDDDKAQSPLHPKDSLRLNPDVRGSTCLLFQDRHFSFQDDKAQSPLHPKDLLRLNPDVRGSTRFSFQD
ncbi:hypothetical protein PCASD_13709 [Puccinia coronata f. sp. avenae]|uniref:CCHC-type domain-containing protein n=1 Tax=Puccinia coronata f. sp. avenae TaxID=200324 RepID=A0A2N5UFB8_9BASI|nr:hypothetical protein PCASD_13709 [Puccinia coronata f. sp. avenae]